MSHFIDVEQSPKFINLLDENTGLEVDNQNLKIEMDQVLKENEDLNYKIDNLVLELKLQECKNQTLGELTVAQDKDAESMRKINELTGLEKDT